MMIMMTNMRMDTMVVDVTTEGRCSDGTEIDDEITTYFWQDTKGTCT